MLTQHRQHEAELARELKHRHPLPPSDRWGRRLLRRVGSTLHRLRWSRRQPAAAPQVPVTE